MSTPILTINDLTKYFDDTPVLDKLSLSVTEGEVLVVLGPSGCGKSTLLRCINGLEPYQYGDIRIRGQTVTDMPLLRQKIGMVFQQYDLFPHLDVLNNLLLGPTKVQKRPRVDVEAEARILLRRVGLEEKANRFPRELSGGQKQRVAIIRSLLLHPEIILFDEVTASLDPEMVREVLELIGELAQEGRTMIIVTHELQFARAIADRIIFLEHGQIVEETDAQTFFTNPKTDRAKAFLSVFDFSTIH